MDLASNKQEVQVEVQTQNVSFEDSCQSACMSCAAKVLCHGSTGVGELMLEASSKPDESLVLQRTQDVNKQLQEGAVVIDSNYEQMVEEAKAKRAATLANKGKTLPPHLAHLQNQPEKPSEPTIQVEQKPIQENPDHAAHLAKMKAMMEAKRQTKQQVVEVAVPKINEDANETKSLEAQITIPNANDEKPINVEVKPTTNELAVQFSTPKVEANINPTTTDTPPKTYQVEAVNIPANNPDKLEPVRQPETPIYKTITKEATPAQNYQTISEQQKPTLVEKTVQSPITQESPTPFEKRVVNPITTNETTFQRDPIPTISQSESFRDVQTNLDLPADKVNTQPFTDNKIINNEMYTNVHVKETSNEKTNLIEPNIIAKELDQPQLNTATQIDSKSMDFADLEETITFDNDDNASDSPVEKDIKSEVTIQNDFSEKLDNEPIANVSLDIQDNFVATSENATVSENASDKNKVVEVSRVSPQSETIDFEEIAETEDTNTIMTDARNTNENAEVQIDQVEVANTLPKLENLDFVESPDTQLPDNVESDTLKSDENSSPDINIVDKHNSVDLNENSQTESNNLIIEADANKNEDDVDNKTVDMTNPLKVSLNEVLEHFKVPTDAIGLLQSTNTTDELQVREATPAESSTTSGDNLDVVVENNSQLINKTEDVHASEALQSEVITEQNQLSPALVIEKVYEVLQKEELNVDSEIIINIINELLSQGISLENIEDELLQKLNTQKSDEAEIDPLLRKNLQSPIVKTKKRDGFIWVLGKFLRNPSGRILAA